MYDIGEEGKAHLLSINLTPYPGYGPRNSYTTATTADGKLLYVVSARSNKSRRMDGGRTNTHLRLMNTVSTGLKL